MAEASKQTTLLAFNKRVKSPYTLQYLQFQQRLKGKKGKQKLPCIPVNTRKSSESSQPDNYLDLAHQLINNKQRLWFGDNKENLFPTIESNDEMMNNIKQKISRMKNRSQQQHTHPRVLQQSEQFTRPIKTTEPALSIQSGSIRSRVHSEAVKLQNNNNQNSIVTFLQYKKSKRQLSIRLKRQRGQFKKNDQNIS